MNSQQLREEIELWLLRLHNEPELWEVATALPSVMATVKNHIDGVIGEDFKIPHHAHATYPTFWKQANELRATQRNRAGGY